jgi:hypothetical protein
MLDDPDPKVRLKAVEMIGKIADVGLFAERTEITIINKTTEELEKELVGMFKDYIDVEVKEATTVQELISTNEEPEPIPEEQEVEEVNADVEDK